MDVGAAWARWPEAAGFWEGKARSLFGATRLGEIAAQEAASKHVSRSQLRERLIRLQAIWPDLRERLRAQLLPLQELRNKLMEAGAPVRPEAIGISSQQLRGGFLQAWFIRRRFTVLDLAMQTGLWDDCLHNLFRH